VSDVEQLGTDARRAKQKAGSESGKERVVCRSIEAQEGNVPLG
jgi:hypothetical protein